MKRAIAVAILVAAPAFAQLSDKYAGWASGPVKFLMTAEDVRQWQTVKSDADAEKFIALFWAKRDPTPATAENEFREEFDRRVAFADENFSDGSTRGALSDRGRALILLGPPYRVSGSAGAQIDGLGISVRGRTGSSPAPHGPVADPDTQFWMYAHENKPKFIKRGDFTITFARQEHGPWQLATTERANPEQIFLEAAKAYIVSPNLTTVPNYARAPIYDPSFKRADVKSAYENFRTGNAALAWSEFATSEGEHFVATHLSVPGGTAGQNVTSWAVVADANGKIIDVKESDAALASAGSDVYVERSLQLDPAMYTVTLGASSDGKTLAAARAQITVQALDPNAAAVSALILATSVVPLKTNWEPMDPFTFGGFKVTPNADATFGTAGDLWYFAELRNPGVTGEGRPNIRVEVNVRGTTAKGPVELKIPMKEASLAPLKGETNRWALGTALPLESFRPGDYTIKVRVVDAILNKEYDLEQAFHIRG